VPNLDYVQYYNSIGADFAEGGRRVDRIVRNAVQAFLESPSEFSWEADIRNDVFGKIRDDTRLRMFVFVPFRHARSDNLSDKRKYEFKTTDKATAMVDIKFKIPDATLGLASYRHEELDATSREFCSTAHPSLAKDALMLQMFLRKCGLVVDPKWGNPDLLFPFGVYEAKKSPIYHEDAKSQVYHAATTYLSMLDDLARNPQKLAEYQSPDSDKYQIFCFTSAGPQWRGGLVTTQDLDKINV